jgi:hypothetical protein
MLVSARLWVPPFAGAFALLAIATARFRLFTDPDERRRTVNRRIAIFASVLVFGIVSAFIAGHEWLGQGSQGDVAATLISVGWCAVVGSLAVWRYSSAGTVRGALTSAKSFVSSISGWASVALTACSIGIGVCLEKRALIPGVAWSAGAVASVFFAPDRRTTIVESLRLLLVLSLLGCFRVGAKGLIGSAVIGTLLFAVLRWWHAPVSGAADRQ